MLDDDHRTAPRAQTARPPVCATVLSAKPVHAMLCLVLAATLAACGKRAPETPAQAGKAVTPVTTTPAARPAPARTGSISRSSTAPVPAAAASAFKVHSVTLGSAVDEAHHIREPATHFAPDDKTIYASVASTGVTSGIALNARWRYLEGAGQLISSVTQRLASEGPATTTFTLHNPDLWPEGKYDVQISVDGKPVDTRTFTITK